MSFRSSLVVVIALAACKDQDPPTWEHAAIEQGMHREGYGEGFALAAADLDGDGSQEILYGGRGLAALDADAIATHHPRWQTPWPRDGALSRDGDNEWVMALATTEIDGDGVPDVLLVDSHDRAVAVRGADGAVLWSRALDTTFTPARLALFDANGDDVEDFFPSGGFAAYDGKTGDKLWEHEMPFPAVFVHAAELDGEAGDDLLIVRELDEEIGGWERSAAAEDVTVYARDAAGELIWEAVTPSSPVSAVAADLDGDGVDEAVVGHQTGLVAVGAAGERWSVELPEGVAWHLQAVDLDGDGRDEVAVGIGWGERGRLLVLAHDGRTLWSEDRLPSDVSSLTVVDLDEDGALDLLVTAGTAGAPSAGGVFAFRADGEALWSIETGLAPSVATTARFDGADVVLVGGRSTQLLALDPRSGEPAWEWNSGGFVQVVVGADLDGDGADEVLSGDERGVVVASARDTGDELWRVRLDVGLDGLVTGLDFGEIAVASGWRFDDARGGLLEAVATDGTSLWSRTTPAPLFHAQLVDLDGDGIDEIVAGHLDEGDGCGVSAWDLDGGALWDVGIGPCLSVEVAVGDSDGDGTPEIGYADSHFAGPWHVALIEADGIVRWSEDLTDRDSEWVAVVEGGLVHGGWHAEPEGHVTFRAADGGAVHWVHRPSTGPDTEAPGAELAGGSLHGIVVPDQDGDGRAEILSSSYPGDVTLLDGATGDEIWTVRTEPADAGPHDRHDGASLAYVPASDVSPPWLVVAQDSYNRNRSEVWMLDLDGSRIATFEREGWGAAAATTSFGAVVGGGLGITGYAAKAR